MGPGTGRDGVRHRVRLRRCSRQRGRTPRPGGRPGQNRKETPGPAAIRGGAPPCPQPVGRGPKGLKNRGKEGLSPVLAPRRRKSSGAVTEISCCGPETAVIQFFCGSAAPPGPADLRDCGDGPSGLPSRLSRPGGAAAAAAAGALSSRNPDGPAAFRPGVLAGVGTAGLCPDGAGRGSRGRGGPCRAPSAPPTAVGGIFLPPPGKKSGKPGMIRKVLLYNRRGM